MARNREKERDEDEEEIHWRKTKKDKDKESWFSLHPDTQKTVFALLGIGLAVILLLSSFEKAGPAGNFLYKIFGELFGWGYYLLPFTLLTVAGVLLVTERQRVMGVTIVGAFVLILSGLGLIDIISPKSGGLVGSLIGTMQIPFGYTASLVLTSTFLIAAVVTTLNTSIKLKNPFVRGLGSILKSPGAKGLTVQEEKNIKEVEKNAQMPANDKAETHNGTVEERDNEEDLQIVSGEENIKRRSVPAQKSFKNYVAPPLSLLKSSIEKPAPGDLRANANIIKRTLESFGIPVEMSEINVGPKVTRYTLKPAEGVKISKIIVLNSDLALALAAHPIRIEAPIPGKSLVGIVVPNKAAAIVRLGSLMAYPELAASGPLGFVLGRDVSGNPIFADIDKMPHLLIAGATGSGKSVALHALIVSLLYKNSPETLRLVMIDPKRVELTTYNDIPHLISPVVTDGKKAVGVFRWAIKEMENRYEILQAAGNRDIKSYNAAHKSELLPYVVLIIDELADLMAAYSREVESSIVRIAQMARATGIHLVVATQRPSVEVITGLIKANITSRMALQVASQIDSRTILDSSGAEKLLGGGDMLFVSAELSKPKRIQGAFISEEEITAVADFIRKNNELELSEIADAPDAGDDTPNQTKEIFDEFANEENEEDDKYEEAVEVIREAKKASATLLQRRLGVGYARAAKLLDIMEAKGIIGPGDGAKPREVFL
ncbi:MAG TPA: DNA translocase FtsK [Candidatus Paceibacterota bacterium]